MNSFNNNVFTLLSIFPFAITFLFYNDKNNEYGTICLHAKITWLYRCQVASPHCLVAPSCVAPSLLCRPNIEVVLSQQNWPIKTGLPQKRWLTGNHLMVFKVSKFLTRFVGYYYGKNQDSLQAVMDTCGLQTQVFHLPETKAGNLSVFAGDVIEETQCYWLEVLAITANVLLDFVNSPY